MFNRNRTIFLIFVISIFSSAVFAASSPRMRPYAGIGLLVFSSSNTDLNQDLQLPLYEEPGLLRIGMLNSSSSPGNAWLFGSSEKTPPLIVSAQKGDWVRVIYDDAGREAWLEPQNRGHFESWDQFLRQQTGSMIPGLPSHYYLLHQQPGGKSLTALTPKQVFKVLKLENTWSMVLTSQAQIGWLRWCDDDGRLLVRLDH